MNENKLNGGDDEENKFSNQIFIISEIKDLKTEQIFFLISTHLKSKIHNENIRLIQTQGIISYINEKGLFKKNIIVMILMRNLIINQLLIFRNME